MELEDFDRTYASAWLLGHDARKLLLKSEDIGAAALTSLLTLLASQVEPDGPLTLITDMRSGDAQADFCLLKFFNAALEGKQTP